MPAILAQGGPLQRCPDVRLKGDGSRDFHMLCIQEKPRAEHRNVARCGRQGDEARTSGTEDCLVTETPKAGQDDILHLSSGDRARAEPEPFALALWLQDLSS